MRISRLVPLIEPLDRAPTREARAVPIYAGPRTGPVPPLPGRNRALRSPQPPISAASLLFEVAQGRVLGVAVVLPSVALLNQPAADVPPVPVDHHDQPAVLVRAPYIKADAPTEDQGLEGGRGLEPVRLVLLGGVDTLEAYVAAANLNGVAVYTLVTTASIPTARLGASTSANISSQRIARPPIRKRRSQV